MVHLPQNLILGHEGVIFLVLGYLYFLYSPHLPSGLALGPKNLRECALADQLKQVVVSIDGGPVGLDHVLIEERFVLHGDLPFHTTSSHVPVASKNKKYMTEKHRNISRQSSLENNPCLFLYLTKFAFKLG